MQLFYCNFAKGEWNSKEWMLVKSPRWDYFGDWIQGTSYIENKTPKDVTTKELLGTRKHETYTSMVLQKKHKGDITISSTMEFTDQMAPLIVIAPEIGKSKSGFPEYREHYEVVVFDKGINVWHHYFKNRKPYWKKATYSLFKLLPNTKYKLKVKISHTSKGKMLAVIIEDHEMGYLDDSLPDDFYVGITGCEGVNRFYNFSLDK